MLKKLRFRLVAVTMLIVFAMLCAIFALTFSLTRNGLEQQSMTMMETIASDPLQLNWPNTSSRLPYFTLRVSLFGEIRVTGTSYYDISDPELLADLVSAVAEAGTDTGLLKEYALRFYRTAYGGSEYIIFADVSSEAATLRALARTCVFIGLGSLAVFFLLSLLLARWAVKPVEKAWKQQTEFVSDASHELKTPLTVILTNAEMLRSPEAGPEEKERYSANILSMAERMRSLVESLLSLARADNGVLPASFEDVDLSALVSEAVLPFEPVFFERGLTLESRIEPGITVRGSGSYLRQVTDILLDNARKYASGGTVTLTLEKAAHSKALLRVYSPGEIIPEEERESIFRRFYRIDKARDGDGSYGLGLAIARSIVTEHRGKIWCEGAENGNCFCVQLPLKG